MFTGIVQAMGQIVKVDRKQPVHCSLQVQADAPGIGKLRAGDSVAVQGVCLTVTSLAPGADGRVFMVDASSKTCACTTFADVCVGDRVNLEPSLTLAAPLGGHIVYGHADGVGEVVAHDAQRDGCIRLGVQVPGALIRYLCPRGAICVDGVSLTVNAVRDTFFEVNLVPLTLQKTTLRQLQPGMQVNLEVDPMARYAERLLDFMQGTATARKEGERSS